VEYRYLEFTVGAVKKVIEVKGGDLSLYISQILRRMDFISPAVG